MRALLPAASVKHPSEVKPENELVNMVVELEHWVTGDPSTRVNKVPAAAMKKPAGCMVVGGWLFKSKGRRNRSW